MLAKAVVHFSQRGFQTSTRDIARALGVTQALIYKHFKSKEDLIEQTLASVLSSDAEPGPWLDQDLPVRDALLAYYRAFVSGATEHRMRLFMQAGLDGRSWPTRRGHALTRNLFLPAIAALRNAAGLPGFDQRPAMRGERELVMMLHASMVFLGIRRHVYGMSMPDSLDDVVALYVDTFIRGALPAMRDLHQNGEASLKVPLAAPSPSHDAGQTTAPGPKQTSRT